MQGTSFGTKEFTIAVDSYFSAFKIVLNNILQIPTLEFQEKLLNQNYVLLKFGDKIPYTFIFACRGGKNLEALSEHVTKVRSTQLTTAFRSHKATLPSTLWLLAYHAFKGKIELWMPFWDHIKHSITIEDFLVIFKASTERSIPISSLDLLVRGYKIASRDPSSSNWALWARFWQELQALLKDPRFVPNPINTLEKLPEELVSFSQDAQDSILDHPEFNVVDAIEAMRKKGLWRIVQYLVYKNNCPPEFLRELLTKNLPMHVRLECLSGYETQWPLQSSIPVQSVEHRATAVKIIEYLEDEDKDSQDMAKNMIEIFFDKSCAEVDQLHIDGWTILNTAIGARRLTRVNFILESHADLLVTSSRGCNPLTLARALDDKPLLARILRKIRERKQLNKEDFNKVLAYLLFPDGDCTQFEEYFEFLINEELLKLTGLAQSEQQQWIQLLNGIHIERQSVNFLLDHFIEDLGEKKILPVTYKKKNIGIACQDEAQFQGLKRACAPFDWLNSMREFQPFCRVTPKHKQVSIPIDAFFHLEKAVFYSQVALVQTPAFPVLCESEAPAPEKKDIGVDEGLNFLAYFRTYTPLVQNSAKRRVAQVSEGKALAERIKMALDCNDNIATQLCDLISLDIDDEHVLTHFGIFDGSSRLEVVQRVTHLFPFFFKLIHYDKNFESSLHKGLHNSLLILGEQFVHLNEDELQLNDSLTTAFLPEVILKTKNYRVSPKEKRSIALTQLLEEFSSFELDVLNLHFGLIAVTQGINALKLSAA